MLIWQGNIVVPAASSKNNTTTAVPFDLPTNVRQIWIRTTGAELGFECKPDTASPSAFSTTAARMFPLAAGIAYPLDIDGSNYGPTSLPVIAVFNTSGGSETAQIWYSL